MLKRFKSFSHHLLSSRFGTFFLSLIAALESIIFPIPTDFFLISIVLYRPKKWFYLASVTVIFSVIGGVIGYFLGLYLWQDFTLPLIAMYGYENKIHHFEELYQNWGVLTVFIAGLTPLPYKLVTLMSGMFHLPLSSFILASLLSRGIRFYIVSYCTSRFGPLFESLLSSHQKKVTLIMGMCIFIVYIMINFVFK